MKPLSGLDAAFLYLETPETPMHVGSVHLYRVPARQRATFFDRAVKHVAARLHLAPVFTRRIATLPLAVASPMWVEDREVDLAHHIRRIRLPRPGTMATLEATVAKLHAEPLDRDRPLWMFYVIEGLASGHVAWYSKIHHATLDGAAGVQLAQAILDPSPVPRKVPKPKKRALEKSPGMGELLGAALRKSAGEYTKLIRQIPELARVVKAGLASGGGGAGRRDKGAGLGLPIGPTTSLNVPITAERAFATASIPLAEVKAIAKRHDAKVNDVVLAIVSGALRRYLVGHGSVPRSPLVAAMPVSLRAADDRDYSTRATMVLANLATHLADPLQRLRAIRSSAGNAKAITAGAKSVIPTDFPSIGAPWVLAAAARAYGYTQGVKSFPPLANLVVSNVPGPQAPLYLAGARMLTYWPASIVEHGLGLNITVQSYCGSLDFGLVAARKAVPDIRSLVRALYDSHEELKKTAG
ncbi:MAG: wax ester/triacylglycerol synthase family O-acyltransferase [Betaproteobacteria bacterium]|nr:wax ester/triacylglycerol synthase family O-acyltransferase [Betaproteobacteria bacterium]